MTVPVAGSGAVPVPVAVGLVGAGPWATGMHAPMLAAGPETTLAGIWSRRPAAAAELAAAFDTVAAGSLAELLDRCEAVAFAVPPQIQADLATRAAGAGKALLLEKPLALDLASATRLAAAVQDAGVVSQLVLSKRYHPATRAFLAEARRFDTIGARAHYVHGAFLAGPFATGWRLEWGALLDLGPHVLDLLEVAVGPIHEVHSTGDPRSWIELTCKHRDGAVGQVSLSGAVAVPAPRAAIELYGPDGALTFDAAGIDHSECWPVIRHEFATAVRAGVPHELDVRRGLRLQQLIDQAQRHHR